MKKCLLMLAILVLAVSPVFAAVVFIAGADYDPNTGAPASVTIDVMPGDVITLGVFVNTGGYLIDTFDLAIVAPVAAGAWAPAALSDTVTPSMAVENASLPVNVSHMGGTWFGGGFNGTTMFASYTFTVSEELTLGDSFDITFYEPGYAYVSANWGADMFYGSGSVTVNVVPEPATLALLGIGLASLVGIRRKRS